MEKPNVRFHDGQILSEEPLNKAMEAVDYAVEEANKVPEAVNAASSAAGSASAAAGSASAAAAFAAAIKAALEAIKDSGDIPAATVAQVVENTVDILMIENDNTKINSQSIDFGFSDESGNILVKFQDGHVKTKNFDSSNVKDLKFKSSDIDFAIADDNYNILFKIEGGHIKTKNFDSSNLNSHSILNNKKISFLGDSITNYGYYVDALSELTGCLTNNYGIGGTTISTSNNSFINRVPQIDINSDIIVVEGGVNDWGRGVQLGSKASGLAGDISTFYGALFRLAKDLVDRFPTKLIVWLTPMHCQYHTSDYSSDIREYSNNMNVEYSHYGGGKLIEYVNAIKEVTAMFSQPCIDLYSNIGIFPLNEENASEFTLDRLHPNVKGGKRMAAYIKPILENLFYAYNINN